MTEKEFTSLVPELRQTALHVCRGCGTDGMTAEDVAQDTMLRLWAIRKDITSAQHAKGLTGRVFKIRLKFGTFFSRIIGSTN